MTLGTEIAVAAGPWGAGAAVEAGKERAAVFSYINSRGMYAGVEVVGQAFFSRTEENGSMYHWPGVKAADIVSCAAVVQSIPAAYAPSLEARCPSLARHTT